MVDQVVKKKKKRAAEITFKVEWVSFHSEKEKSSCAPGVGLVLLAEHSQLASGVLPLNRNIFVEH